MRAGKALVQDRSGHIYDGMGVTEHHSCMARLHGLDIDRLNTWWWDPHPLYWRDPDDGLFYDGLTLVWQKFTPPYSHYTRVQEYLQHKYPNIDAWRSPDPVHESLRGREVLVDGELVAL